MSNRISSSLNKPASGLRSRKVRTPFRYWIDDTWNRTVRFAKQNPWLYAVAIWAPVFLLIALFKLVKFQLMAVTVSVAAAERALPYVLYKHALLPTMLVAAAFLVGLIVQLRYAYRGYYLLPATIVAFALFAFGVQTALAFPPDWMSTDFLLVVQSDLVAAGCAAAATALIFAIVRGLLLRLFLVLVHVFAVLVAWLSCFEFGYFLQTGSMADSYMLRYTVSHLSDLSYAVGSQLDVASISVLLVPIVFALVPMQMANRAARKRSVHVHSYSWRMKRGIALTALVVIGFVYSSSMSVRDSVALLRPSAPVGILGDFVSIERNVEPAKLDVGLTVWPSATFAAEKTDSTVTPNIVFLIVESTRSSYSEGVTPDEVMPFLDSLRVHSLDVRDMSVVVPHTNKALVPMLCGVYPELSQSASRSITNSCLPRLLDRIGYETVFFTPADLDFEQKGSMLESMGYDEVVGGGAYDVNGFAQVNYFGMEDNVMLQPSLEWMQDRVEKGSPFFATFLTLTSHHDYTIPPSWTTTRHSDRKLYNQYLNTISYQDNFVRSIVTTFEKNGWSENTMFVIASDHGEAFSEHGLQFHSAVPYQEVTHVPAMIYAPGLVTPREVFGPRQQTDIVPTILESLNLSFRDDELVGQSLHSRPDSSREIFMAGWIENQSMAYRIGSGKFVYHFRRKPMEYYDLSVDPLERHNLVETIDSDSLEMVERTLLTWRRFVNDQYASFDDLAKTQN